MFLMKAIRIGAIVGVLSALAALAACNKSATSSASAAGLTRVTLQADWYPQPEHGGFYTALAKGYYRDEGLDLSIQPGGPYVVVPQQVAAGAAQFGMASSDQILESVGDGQSLVAVAATMQRDPQGIMVRK
jgi:NitT/TauT family transport system substrate-binding protein